MQLLKKVEKHRTTMYRNSVTAATAAAAAGKKAARQH